jgi:hypothetical protein
MVRAEHFRVLLVAMSLVVGLCLGAAPRTAIAHGDDAVAPPPPNASVAPRLAAQSADFELVAVPQDKTLSIYLDRFADNQPVIGAKIDVEVDGKTMTATAAPSGTYILTGDWVAQPGHHDMVFTILSDQGSDILAGTLDIPAAPPAATGSRTGGGLQVPSINNVLAFLLGMLATVALQRRSSFSAIVRGPADRLRGRANHIAGVARSRLVDANARLRQATSVAKSRFSSTELLPDFQRWAMRARAGGLELAAAPKALRDRFDRTVRSPLAGVLSRRAAKSGNREIHPWRRFLAAIVPFRPQFAAGRFEVSTVAGVLLVAIVVAIALFLFGRGVLAHEGHDEAPPASSVPGAPGAPASSVAQAPGAPAATDLGSGPHRLLDGSLFVPKESQRLLNVRTVVSHISEVGRTVRMVGQVIADPGTSGEVHASIRGRLEPYHGAWPKVGQKVDTGDVLAWVVPVVNPIDRGIIMQQVAQIDHEIGLIQERLPGLGADNADASSRELDDARADLANLIRRRDAIAAVIRDRDTLRAPLLAPSTGIVAASFAAAGQIVDEQQKLFTVVDLKRLWVEAYAYDIEAMGTVVDANAQGAAGGNYHLKFVSRGPQLQRQTIPLYFQIDNPDATVSVGSLVSVLVETKGARSGVILPRTAVTRNNSGQDIVWQHANPENFVPIPVRTESIDGKNVLIAAGLPAEKRIVVEAADLLNEVR